MVSVVPLAMFSVLVYSESRKLLKYIFPTKPLCKEFTHKERVPLALISSMEPSFDLMWRSISISLSCNILGAGLRGNLLLPRKQYSTSATATVRANSKNIKHCSPQTQRHHIYLRCNCHHNLNHPLRQPPPKQTWFDSFVFSLTSPFWVLPSYMPSKRETLGGRNYWTWLEEN